MLFSPSNLALHFVLVSCLLASFLIVTLWWWALSECSPIVFSHLGSLIKLQSSPCLGITQQREKATSLSLNASPIHSHDSKVVHLFPRWNATFESPSIRLMFSVRLHAIFNPGSIFKSSKSLSNLIWRHPTADVNPVIFLLSAVLILPRNKVGLYKFYCPFCLK